MNIKYEASFEKDLRNIRDKALLKRIKDVIEDVKRASYIKEIAAAKS